MAKDEAQQVTLSATDLATIIQTAVSTAITEAKKPVITEADKLRLEQDQEDRRQQAALIKQMNDNKRAAQVRCLHEARDGHTHTVYIQDDIGGYILCQKCQVVIRPGTEPKDYKGTAFYNTELFNRLFQRSGTTGVWD